MTNLVLGTAQLGFKYGINNAIGKPSLQQAYEILDTAYDNGIRILDTALVYGDSEKIIGTYMKEKGKTFEICTKTPKLYENQNSLEIIEENINKSLDNLNVSNIDFYLFHNFSDLVRLYKEDKEYLKGLKNEGIIKKIGVSIYDTEELEYIVKNIYDLVDVVQIPFNIFDLRWIQTDLLDKTKNKGIEVAARSAFLQGVLFMNGKEAKKIHPLLEGYLTTLKYFSDNRNMTIGETALTFIKSQNNIDYILVGCESKEQIITNVNNFKANKIFNKTDLRIINDNFLKIENQIIDPRKWS
ncbi:aldo/keto reductase [Clostridium sporogenes]|uniref:Aldo/keto reductase n=1 Tax=Clostridium sporogenes TaxID=1509 RepID=A0AAE4JS05_CLOSG|nr:aldo/keto reductase [Clostridium sporogenes]MDS1002890.1 aldo/keto reductase [Clostridium sporogenes]